jgi:hypothetical protein
MSLQISLVFVSDGLHSRGDPERKEGSPASSLKLMTCYNNIETGKKWHIYHHHSLPLSLKKEVPINYLRG